MSVETASAELAGELFTPYVQTVSEYVRFALVRRNLTQLAVTPGQRVLAIGSESTIDALSLAQMACEVTVIDVDNSRLGAAEERIGEVPIELSRHVLMRAGALPDALQRSDRYDLVLCHEAAAYEAYPDMLIERAAHLVKSGGYLSLLEKGYDGTMISLLHCQRHADANNLQSTGRTGGVEGEAMWAFHPRRIRHMLWDAGITTFEWYGVNVTRHLDVRRLRKISAATLEAIVAEQEQVGRRHDARGVAPLLHFIGQVGNAA